MPAVRISCCFNSSRLKTINFLGRYSFSITSTNRLPNDPVPPVTSTTCSDQLSVVIYSRSSEFQQHTFGQSIAIVSPQRCESRFFHSSEPIQSRPFAYFVCDTC